MGGASPKIPLGEGRVTTQREQLALVCLRDMQGTCKRRPQAERSGVHGRHMQLIFTMLSQPPPRQYNPPLGARIVCQENKRVSTGEAGRTGRERGVVTQEDDMDTEERVRWKLERRGTVKGRQSPPIPWAQGQGDVTADRQRQRLGEQGNTQTMRGSPTAVPCCTSPAVTPPQRGRAVPRTAGPNLRNSAASRGQAQGSGGS